MACIRVGIFRTYLFQVGNFISHAFSFLVRLRSPVQPICFCNFACLHSRLSLFVKFHSTTEIVARNNPDSHVDANLPLFDTICHFLSELVSLGGTPWGGGSHVIVRRNANGAVQTA